jgi:MFS family permease
MNFSRGTSTSPGIHVDRRLTTLLVVLCGVIFLDALDVSMVGMALPSIRSGLRLNTSDLQWVVSGYVLGYGGFLLLGGRTADLMGRRRTLLIALGVFTVASVFGGLADDGSTLIIARFVKGVSAAFTAPAGLSIITTTFTEGPARNRALSIYTTVGASGFSLGLVLGGLLTELGWRWTFLVPVPIAAALLLVARRVIPTDRAALGRGHRDYDIPGAVTITAGMLLLVRTIVNAPQAGWTTAATVASFGLAVTLLGAFVAIELRSAHPLVRLGILRDRNLTLANLGAITLFGSYVGFQFIGTLYMQTLLHWSSLSTALAFLPAGAMVVLGSTRIAGLVNRFGTPRLVALGLGSLTAGYALFLRIGLNPFYPTIILPTMVLLGIGFALTFPSLNIQATAGVGDNEQGLASGLLNTSFQLGGAIVLAAVTAVVTSKTGNATDPRALLDGFRPGIGVVTAVGAAGLVIALAGVLAPRLADKTLPQETG